MKHEQIFYLNTDYSKINVHTTMYLLCCSYYFLFFSTKCQNYKSKNNTR